MEVEVRRHAALARGRENRHRGLIDLSDLGLSGFADLELIVGESTGNKYVYRLDSDPSGQNKIIINSTGAAVDAGDFIFV